MLVIILILFQLALPLLIWRWLRRYGWSKRIIWLAALPVPALALARGTYLFLTIERSADHELSTPDEYRLTAALIFWGAAVMLYGTGVLVAWMSGNEADVSRPESLEDTFS